MALLPAYGSGTTATQTNGVQDYKPDVNYGSSGFASTSPQSNLSAYVPDSQVLANQAVAAKLGIKIPGLSAQSTTTMSSNKTADIADIKNTADNLSKTGVTTPVNSDGTPGTPVHADGSVYTPGATNQSTAAPANGISQGGYVGETYYPVGSTLPQDSAGSYSSTTQFSPTDMTVLNNLNDQKSQNDALTASIIGSITNQYQQLIKKQQDINAGQEAGETSLLLHNGGLQHTASGTNVLAGVVSHGLSEIADLNSKEQMAQLQAQQAGQTKDFEIMGKINQQIMDIRDAKIATATKINDTIATQNKKLADDKLQANKDTAISSIVASGVTDPAKILSTLQAQGDTTISLADIKSSIDVLTKANPEAAGILSIMKSASENGAAPEILAAIGQAKSAQDAILAAGSYLQTATGTMGDYLQYVKDTKAKGLVPADFTTYKAQQDAATAKQKASEAYSSAYASASGKAAAEGVAGKSNTNQQKLEQQYRQVLAKEFSARTGALGVENAKVNQANHLNSLLAQYYDPKTGAYNVPKAQYAELVLGLATLISPTGSTDSADRAALMSKTAAGDLAGAVQYITGEPQTGNTQGIIKNLVDSIDRQATTAVSNRESALQDMRAQAPTDLEQSRIDALNKSTTMVPYSGADRLSKSTVDNYVKSNPKEAEAIAKLYEVPGATDKDIEDYLKAQGKLK